MDIIYDTHRRYAVQKQTVPAIAKDMGLSRPTVRKYLKVINEPKYVRVESVAPVMGGFEEQLKAWLEENIKLPRPRRRTGRRLFKACKRWVMPMLTVASSASLSDGRQHIMDPLCAVDLSSEGCRKWFWMPTFVPTSSSVARHLN